MRWAGYLNLVPEEEIVHDEADVGYAAGFHGPLMVIGIAVVITAIIFFFYLVSFIKDIRFFKRIDPPKPFDKD